MSNKLLQSCVDDEIKSIGQGYIARLEWMEKKSKRYKQLKCDRCGKYHIWKRKESADTNQANEELRRAIGECLGIFPEEFDEYLPNNVGKKNIDAIEHLIRTEKLKLLNEVRELVVGGDEPGITNIMIAAEHAEQLAKLNKLEAEL